MQPQSPMCETHCCYALDYVITHGLHRHGYKQTPLMTRS